MMFVDGENLAIRAKEAAAAGNINLVPSDHYLPDVFYWLAGSPAKHARIHANNAVMPIEAHAIRAFYYATVPGGTQSVPEVEEALWRLGFAPRVFHRRKARTAKGLDISLATDMLANAVDDNYDVAVLVAGDADYVPLVQEIQRRGKIVFVWFFEKSGLSDDLRRSADVFIPFESVLTG
jgi:uncharacterized LabA/DUF88 family protein